MELHIHCPNCGEKVKSAFFKEDDLKKDFYCEKCNVAFDAKAVELLGGEQKRNTGYLFDVYMSIHKNENAFKMDASLNPLWSCILCGKHKLSRPDEDMIYTCGDCGLRMVIEQEEE